MSVPKKKRTSSSVGRRRSHHSLAKIILKKCPKCGKAVEHHKVCAFCGSYKGKEAVEIKTKTKKKEEK